jgi:hypothetical protein
MARLVAPRAWSPRILCWALAICILANVAAAAAAWHRYQLLGALPPEHSPFGSDALLRADMWFGNLMSWRKAVIAVSGLLLIAWLDDMRSLANTIWPEGQRRSRAWLLFGWWLPIGNLFIPKMFVNDLWAAGDPAHRRGHALLSAWWLSALLAFGSSGTMLGDVSPVAHAAQAREQMQQVILSDACFVVLASLTIAVVSQLSRRLGRVPTGQRRIRFRRSGWRTATA